MKDRSASLLPLAMLILLAALTFWLNQIIQGDKPRGPLRHDPDYWVEQFKVRRFDTGGKLQHTLVADKLVHFPDDDTTLITNPHITFNKSPESEIFSRTALMGPDGKVVDLIDDVQVIRYSDPSKSAPTVLETRRLRVFPDDEKAHGNDPVRITQGMSVINGVGLDVDNKSGLSILHGRVTGTIHRKTIEKP